MTRGAIHILLVDDDKYFRHAVKTVLSDIAVFTEADDRLKAHKLLQNNHFDLALVDMHIDGPEAGIEILKYAKSKKIHTITLSSQTDEKIIEKAYLSGCNHFLAKRSFNSHLKPYIQKFIKQYQDSPLEKLFSENYITQHSGLKKQIENLCKIDLREKTILITGETGVGKSILGRFLHSHNYPDNAPFIHLNCSEISENLIESELFGHEKGAFTGATSQKKGKLEQAHNGTLFLDEIATMSQSMQQKILQAIETGSFSPVGSNQVIQSRFTLITATCENLFEKIANGKFRQDLYYRISGLNLNIPPLRERKKDIPLLVKYFLKQSPRRVVLKEEALEKIIDKQWPGNIRELKKFIDILTLNSEGIIDAEDILPCSTQINLRSNQLLTPAQINFIQQNGLRDFMRTIEEECVKSSMLKHKGKITHVIRELKISSSAFYRIFETMHH